MATSPLFGWEEPDDVDLVKDGAAAIRTLGNAIDTSMGDLLGGTTGQVLSKASNTNMDFTWVTSDDANAIQNTIVDAKGDLIAASGSDTPARLAVGANDLVLTAASGEATGLKYTGGWTSWTPTFTNFTLGNGGLVARYQQIGKTVNYYLNVNLGSTSSVTGRIIWTLPVTPNQAFGGGLGYGLIVDSGVGGIPAFLGGWSATQAYLAVGNGTGTYVTESATTATIPMTWAVNDFFFINASYEVG